MAVPLRYNFRNLMRRRGRTVLTVLGMGVTVFVAVLTLSLVWCMWDSVENTASPDNVIILSRKGQNAIQSQIEGTVPALLESLPHLRRTREGMGYVSGELVYMIGLTFDEHPEAGRVQAFVRGVEPETAFLVNDRVKVRASDAARGITGPAPDGGILVGPNAHIRLGVPRDWLDVGKVLWYGRKPDDPAQAAGKLVVLGFLDAPGTTYQTEIWFDLSHLMSLTDVRNISQISLKLDSPADMNQALKELRDNEVIKVDAQSESKYYEEYYSSLSAATTMVIIIALVVCAAGILVGMNTMYAAVMGRIREIGTLRVLGFGRSQVLLSFILESVFISLIAGALGTAAAAVLPLVVRDFESMRLFNTMFAFHVAWPVAAAGMGLAVLMGLVGALPPAFKGVRLHVVDALRHV